MSVGTALRVPKPAPSPPRVAEVESTVERLTASGRERPARPGPIREPRRSGGADGRILGVAYAPGPGGGTSELIGFDRERQTGMTYTQWLDAPREPAGYARPP